MRIALRKFDQYKKITFMGISLENLFVEHDVSTRENNMLSFHV